MCGICGHVGVDDSDLIHRMLETLVHRGPDGEGILRHDDLALGHRRLSIIDVQGGAQPIENEDRSIAIVCNGEIYNYRELREQLLARGHRFRTQSDTEVVLHLYEEDGIECVRELNGMFAFAIWDRSKRTLYLARDRIGIKPLYYVEIGGAFLFASEAKALLEHRPYQPAVDLGGVYEYLALRYSPGPAGMLENLRKLPAGHWMRLRDGKKTVGRYWEPPVGRGPFHGSDQDYLDGFAEQFERSVRRRMISDVPVGAYLSGGLDSSVIVGAMSKLAAHPIRTYSVGFDFEHSELNAAAETARWVGSEHTEIRCTPEDLQLLPEIIRHLDEPIGDPIVIPMCQLARRAKQDVKVVLTGEGADETLGGYLFHKALLSGARLDRLVPGRVGRDLLAGAASLIPASVMNMAFHYPASLGKRGKLKVVDFVRLIGREQFPAAYRHLISLFDERDVASFYSGEFLAAIAERQRDQEEKLLSIDAPELHQILHLQYDHWLPDDILMKQDKMTMAGGLEGRVPFLDHELVEYLAQVPPRLKIQGGQLKLLLRRYATRLLPVETTRRPKMPFYFPMEKYFSDPKFQDVMQDCLSEKTVRERGLFRAESVSSLRCSLGEGEFVHAKQAFSLVALELWFRNFVDRRPAQS